MLSTASSRSLPLQVAVFGKTPRMGDFLRVGSGGPAGEALEQWVEQGLALAENKRNPSWPSTYLAGATYAFVFRPPRASSAKDAVVGVIKPSHDAVGRRYPLVVYSPAIPRSTAPWPHLLPMALSDFFDAAATLLHEADRVTGIAEMQAGLRSVPMPHFADAERYRTEYDAWASATPLEQVWNVVYGGDHRMANIRAVHTIAEAVAPFRGEEAPATKLGLKLPLGPGGVAAAVFWLDVVRRLSRSVGNVRTCFWSFDGTNGNVLVQLGDTAASTLGELWVPDADSEYLCDLSMPASVDVGRFLTKLPPHIAEPLQVVGVFVQDFLDRLAR